MPDTKPLKMCVKLARDIGDDCCHGWEAEWDGTTAAKLIDARVRPLVVALHSIRGRIDSAHMTPECAADIENYCNAALKSAGIE